MARPRGFDRDVALEQAMRIFWRKGFDATSIADLTQEMGIAAPSLYAAFGDKRRLFDEAVQHYAAGPGSAITAALNEPTASTAIHRMLFAAAEQYAAPDSPPGCFIATDPALATWRATSREAIRARLLEAQRSGELSSPDDVDALAGFVSAVLSGMSARARDGADRAQLRAIAKTAMAAWPA